MCWSTTTVLSLGILVLHSNTRCLSIMRHILATHLTEEHAKKQLRCTTGRTRWSTSETNSRLQMQQLRPKTNQPTKDTGRQQMWTFCVESIKNATFLCAIIKVICFFVRFVCRTSSETCLKAQFYVILCVYIYIYVRIYSHLYIYIVYIHISLYTYLCV